tara:strand:- start:9808 stop:10104 length:297 start_codon:yes stop_codon:yes gene_type:complete
MFGIVFFDELPLFLRNTANFCKNRRKVCCGYFAVFPYAAATNIKRLRRELFLKIDKKLLVAALLFLRFFLLCSGQDQYETVFPCGGEHLKIAQKLFAI